MDAKQRGILVAVAVFGTLILLVGGLATGGISARPGVVTGLPGTREKRPEFDPVFLYRSALEDYDRADYVSARALANRLTVVNPKHLGALKLLAAISLREKNYKYALNECRKALTLDPTNITTKLAMASAYRGLGDAREAEKVYRDVIADERSLDGHRKEAEWQLQDMGVTGVGPVAGETP